jgi:hypothetical protein
MNAPMEEASQSEVLDFASFTREVECPRVLPDESWRPVPVRVGPSEVSAFLSFCRGRHIEVRDAIDRQFADLAAVKYPSASAAEERERFVATLAATGQRVAYGTWMFFPWESRIVHLLDRDNYCEVITNRNHDKITRTEQAALLTKCVGVIGLSVGGEADRSPGTPLRHSRHCGFGSARLVQSEPAQRRLRRSGCHEDDHCRAASG